MGHTEKIYIYNPLEEIPVNGNKKLSIIDIYLMNYDLFCELADGKFGFLLAPDVKKFFDKQGKPNPKKAFKNSQEKCKDKWERYNNSRRNRTIRELNEKLINEHVEQKLLNTTLQKEIQWTELLDVHSQTSINRKYECKYFDLNWEFSVTGFKGNDGKWHAHYELKWKNSYEDMTLFGGEYHSELYKAIQQTIIRKEKSNPNPYIKQRAIGEKKKEVEISNRDFVVRTNLFRCYHNEHLVEEIIGIIKVVTPSGETKTEKIPCAYCPECHCFYMLQSQFNRLNDLGVILCQLIEKEDYYKSGKLGDYNVASESLLMRNGYNVKANNGLTDIQRQIILKNIIDNGILTPHRIGSYIDMFIAQKKNMPQYKEAVSKWQKDKAFVLTYRNEFKRNVEIQKIRK